MRTVAKGGAALRKRGHLATRIHQKNVDGIAGIDVIDHYEYDHAN
jgi:hypothetical protein